MERDFLQKSSDFIFLVVYIHFFFDGSLLGEKKKVASVLVISTENLVNLLLVRIIFRHTSHLVRGHCKSSQKPSEMNNINFVENPYPLPETNTFHTSRFTD